MFHLKHLIYFIVLDLIVGKPQLNLWYTDWINERETDNNNNGLQHNCFRINEKDEMISYCLSELPSTFKIENNNFYSKFTFDQLSKKNISSQQLYDWSAPIDLIERYQFYLNQLSIKNNSLVLSKDIFYNCTMNKFGPKCQYELYYHYSYNLSLKEILNNFYNQFEYHPINLTCYIHLQCHRGYLEICLDWTDICNGIIDCFDNGLDEEYCWQLDIHQCKNDEIRCDNGECIPRSFYSDHLTKDLCIDGTDTDPITYSTRISLKNKPLIVHEDRICEHKSLTSSCIEERVNLLKSAMYLIKDTSASSECWLAFQCYHKLSNLNYLYCSKFCQQNECIEILKNNCPDILYIPGIPILFGNIYLAFTKNDSQYYTNLTTKSFYICYTTSDYDYYFINIIKISFKNMTCINIERTYFQEYYPKNIFISDTYFLETLYNELKKYHFIFNYTSLICNRSNMYQCINSSKCISIYRLLNQEYDCPFMDDENINIINNTIILKKIKQTTFRCSSTSKYIQYSNPEKDEYCQYNYNNETKEEHINILFQHICDRFVDLSPILIGERNETDETECEQWKCNNIYTHCNGIWNCQNGADETGCISFLTINCSSNYHLCVSSDTNQFMCLPIEKINDGNIDCLGAIDEPNLCGIDMQFSFDIYPIDFYCRNQSFQSCLSRSSVCDGVNQCKHGDDEQFCITNRTTPGKYSICAYNRELLSNIEDFFCNYRTLNKYWDSINSEFNNNKINNIKNRNLINIQREPRCHRGFDLRVWLNNNLTKDTCLCPRNYYGSQCQYQNQRIHFIVRFRSLKEFYQTIFSIIILLIDNSDNRIIHSYEQITYLSNIYCKFNFKINLFYSTRPKDLTKEYKIHIDFYEKVSFTYRGSELIPIKFPFLPVYPLSLIIDIPLNDIKTQICFNNQCINGKCIKYLNNQNNLTFCQCDPGWSGKYCTIKYTCNCASDSLCIGISANNQSICICPLNKFGPRCLITNSICQKNSNLTCGQNGQCIWINDYSESEEKFICLCKNGFSGDKCHIPDNKFNISFDKTIDLPLQIFIHFIEITEINDVTSLILRSVNRSAIRSTTFRTIINRKDSLIVNWSRPFHFVFIESFNKTYYLVAHENVYKKSSTIIKMIKSSDRCLNINEILDKNLIQYNLIRRIKYYHLPCQNQTLNLSCFYDEIHLCSCYHYEKQRLTNCFKFDHNIKFDCFGKNFCENNGDCLQDDSDCPTRSICKCKPCFFGTHCQFNTNGFGLSLDAILGYHILPNININNQLFIVKISLSLTIIFFIGGLINSILSMMTFKNKSVREVGCGLYLLISSINTLLIMLIFLLKFLFLLLSQMNIIKNQLFLSIQCYLIDFILRICLNIDQWLIACIATERAITTIKGARFNKNKSKKTAKFVIIIIIIIIVITSIHDPISRQLKFEENIDENIIRIWCTVKYSSFLQIYNYIIQIIHFICPFLINLISSILLIIKKSRQQANLHKQRPYKEIRRKQFQQHKHLLTAPIVLVILAIPRLIITFSSKCMRSPNDSWLFLCGYFISFIPSMLTFLIFILPSKFYKKEFNKTARQYYAIIRQCLNVDS